MNINLFINKLLIIYKINKKIIQQLYLHYYTFYYKYQNKITLKAYLII